MRLQSLLLLGLPAVMALVNAAEPAGDVYRSPSYAVARRGIADRTVYAAEPGLDLDLDLVTGDKDGEYGSDSFAAEAGDIVRAPVIDTNTATPTSEPKPKKTVSVSTSSKRKTKKPTTTVKHTLPPTTTTIDDDIGDPTPLPPTPHTTTKSKLRHTSQPSQSPLSSPPPQHTASTTTTSPVTVPHTTTTEPHQKSHTVEPRNPETTPHPAGTPTHESGASTVTVPPTTTTTTTTAGSISPSHDGSVSDSPTPSTPTGPQETPAPTDPSSVTATVSSSPTASPIVSVSVSVSLSVSIEPTQSVSVSIKPTQSVSVSPIEHSPSPVNVTASPTVTPSATPSPILIPGGPNPGNDTLTLPLPTNGTFTLPVPTNGTATLPVPTNGTFTLPVPTNGTFTLPVPTNGTFTLPVPTNGTFTLPAPTNGTFTLPVPTNGTFTVPVTTRKPRPTGTLTTTVNSNSTATTTVRTTHIPSPTTTIPTTTTTTTTTTTPTTITTTTTTTTKSKSHRPRKTTTPWLPSSIEPVAPPKTTATPSPGTSLPDVVIPNLHPDIPPNSFNIQLRLQHVSYYQVIYNGVLAAQLVSFIPEQLSSLLKVDSDDIMVLAIRDASRHSAGSKRSLRPRDNRVDDRGDFRKRDLVTSNSDEDAVQVIVSIPKSHYWTLSGLLKDSKSGLYTPSPENFGQYIDSDFPLSNRPPEAVSKGGSTNAPLTGDNLGTGDPNLVTNAGASGGSSSNGAIIGSLVGLATVAYVGIAMLVIRRYRRRRLAEQDEADRRLQLQRSISAPITTPVNVQGGSQGWGWQGQ